MSRATNVRPAVPRSLARALAATRTRVRRVPLPLTLLLVVTALYGAAWAVAVAPLNGPDEIYHAAYVQSIAETGDGPDRSSGDGPYSTEISIALQELYLDPIRGHPEARPAWDRVPEVERRLDALPDEARSDTTGPNTTGINPPLYYAYGAVAWKLSPDQSLLGRLLAVRLATVLLFVLAVALTWLVAAELFAATWQRFLAAAVVALHPKLAHAGAQIAPDMLLIALVTAFLLFALRLLRRGPAPWDLAGLALAGGGAVLTHPRGLFVLPVAAVVLAIVAWRARPLRLRPVVAGVAALAAIVLLAGLSSAWSDAHSGGAGFSGNAPGNRGFNVREFFAYLWQFYLPRFSFITAGPFGGGYGYRQLFIETFFGRYAHFEVDFRIAVYDRLQIAAFLGLLGLWTAVVVRWREVRARWAPVAVAVAFLGALLMQLHLTSYSSLRDGGTDIVITGRYLLPAIALYGVAIAFVVGSLPRRAAPLAAGVVTALAVLLGLGGLGLTFDRFYG